MGLYNNSDILRSPALIPQPLLPFWEKGSRIEVPLPSWERDLGFDVSAQWIYSHGFIQ